MNTVKPGCNDVEYNDNLVIAISFITRVVSPHEFGHYYIVSQDERLRYVDLIIRTNFDKMPE